MLQKKLILDYQLVACFGQVLPKYSVIFGVNFISLTPRWGASTLFRIQAFFLVYSCNDAILRRSPHGSQQNEMR